MTLEGAIELLKRWGCTIEPSNAGYELTMVDPNGNFLHLSRGSYTILGVNSETGVMVYCPSETHDETTRVVGKAYGLGDNDPMIMATILDMAVEGGYDQEYDQIMAELLPWPEED